MIVTIDNEESPSCCTKLTNQRDMVERRRTVKSA